MSPVDTLAVEFIRILPEPCWLVTPGGEIRAANGPAARLTGIAVSDLVGRRLESLILAPPEKVRGYLVLCARNRQLVPGGFAWRTPGEPAEIRCDGAVVEPRGNGSEGLVFVRCRPRIEATDQFVLLNEKLRALTQEVVQRKKAEMQRDALLRSERAARVQAEQNSRIKDEFLATLSHELRTPLNAIMGWADLIRRNALQDEASLRQGLEVIDRNARAQLRLVEDLLDISHIISGKVRLDVQRVDLIKVVEAAIETVRPAAQAREIRLQVTLDSQTPTLAADPNRLQQIVWNLLANAIKFTPKNGRVQIVLARVNSHVELTVSDNGRGIDPAFLPHVFDRFRQQDGSSTRPVGGLGLGLAIVKELVELHGGSVAATSRGEGLGASFTISLPLPAVRTIESPSAPRAHPHAVQARMDAAADPTLDGLLILVVDDDPDAADLVRRLLESRGAAVTVAASGDEALKGLAASRPDLVISDIGMPGEDGYGFMRRMRQLPADRGGRIPAIALTAFAGSGDRTRALLGGFQLHLSKPTDPHELIAAIASLTGRLGP